MKIKPTEFEKYETLIKSGKISGERARQLFAGNPDFEVWYLNRVQNWGEGEV